MTGVGLAATGIIPSPHLKKGTPDILFHGMDYLGNLCGITNFTDATNENILDKPKVYILTTGINVCVESCPEELDLTQYHCKYEVEAMIRSEIESTRSKNGDDAAMSKQHGLYVYYTSIEECMPYYKSTSYLGYCVPSVLTSSLAADMNVEYDMYNVTASRNLTASKDGISGGEFFDETIADTYVARKVILAFGFGGAMILGFLFLFLLRLPGTSVHF